MVIANALDQYKVCDDKNRDILDQSAVLSKAKIKMNVVGNICS
jgi:hypothetical protein